jgi:TonB family protein
MQMKRTFPLISIFFLFFATLALAQENKPEWVKRSDAYTERVNRAEAQFTPESYQQQGVEGLDDKVLDLNPGYLERSRKVTRETIDWLKKSVTTEKDPLVKQDLEILIKAEEDGLRGSELNEKYRVPYINVARQVFNGIHALLDEQVKPERYPAALVRLRKYAGMIKGTQPLTTLAMARTREGMGSGKKYPAKSQLERDLANTAFLEKGIGELFDKYKLDAKNELATLHEQLVAYDDFLSKEILSKANDDFKLPSELYAYRLQTVGVDIPPEKLRAIAHAAFNDIQKQMQEIAPEVAKQHGFTATDYRDVIAKLKKEQLVGDTILPHYKQRLADIEKIIQEKDLVTLPARAARIRISTDAEAAIQPAPHMEAPRLIGNTGEQGAFVLPLNIPTAPGSKVKKYDDFTFAAASWTLTAHEARPGHELQFDSMVEHGVSQARALYAFNSTNVEGWGLYSEWITKPYMPPDGQLISLQHRLLRAARAYIDPELQAGVLTPEQAKEILMKDGVFSDAMATQEVERYTFRAPGQATSYFYGFTRLLALRNEVEKLLGPRFDQHKYHDFILAQGLLPPDLLRKAVLEQFVPTLKPVMASIKQVDLQNSLANRRVPAIVRLIVDEKGNVLKAELLRAENAEYGARALEAAQHWKFDPATKDGRPVKVMIAVEVNLDAR